MSLERLVSPFRSSYLARITTLTVRQGYLLTQSQKCVYTGNMEEHFTFFWNGPFSQWTEAFFSIGGVEYNCAEQYMMAAKASLFGDGQAFDLIMASSDPREQKRLGRMVKGYNDEAWHAICKHVVYEGSYAKFDQNEDLFLALVETLGTTLVEASPYDAVWGIGFLESAPEAQNRDTWQGKNWLGEILTEVREDLISE